MNSGKIWANPADDHNQPSGNIALDHVEANPPAQIQIAHQAGKAVLKYSKLDFFTPFFTSLERTIRNGVAISAITILGTHIVNLKLRQVNFWIVHDR